jgi:hypothetical protein
VCLRGDPATDVGDGHGDKLSPQAEI